MRYLLAVDSGGTKCDVLLASEDGTALGWGHCDCADPESGRGKTGSGRSTPTVRRAIQQALGGRNISELLIGGMRSELPLYVLSTRLPLSLRIESIWEHETALKLANEPYGLIALAGTGAFVHGALPDGRTLHFDGLGPLLGDAGGGYQIGLAAIRAVAKEGWGPQYRTSLSTAIFEWLGAYPRGDDNPLIAYMMGNPDRAEIASIAKLVDMEANAGDAIARGIIMQAADALADTTRDLVDALSIHDADYPLIGIGSIALRSHLYWECYVERVSSFAPRLRPMRPDWPPVFGVMLTLLHRLNPEAPPSVRETLLQTGDAWRHAPPATHPISGGNVS